MADIELSHEDWLELYGFLLEQLESRGFLDVRREIETAAAAPVFERENDEGEEWILKEFAGGVGQRTLRRKEPFEVFVAALDVVKTRLVELPGVATAIQENLCGPEQRVEFRVDYEKQYAPRQSEMMPLDRLQLIEAEQSAVLEGFNAIGVGLERPGQR